MRFTLGVVALLRLGMMVTIGDFREIEVPGMDFSELLLIDGDLDRINRSDIPVLRSLTPPVEFVHVQEFATIGNQKELVDLSSADQDVRASSIEVISRTRELARSLGTVPVVMHPGGIRPSTLDRARLADNLERSLVQLGPSQLLLENMPWHYWLHKKERMLSNLCVSIDDMARFAPLVDGLTLDICHGYLSRPEGDTGYCQRFMARFGDKVRHLHVSDAAVPDKEGLQIGEGEIDFSWLRGSLPPVLVEIWRGHEDGGRGFREGAEHLKRIESRE